jgi:hypothetical protein
LWRCTRPKYAAPAPAITIATIQSTGRWFSQLQWKSSRFPVCAGVGFEAARGQAKLMSIPPPHIRPPTDAGMPHLPSLNGASRVGQPFSRALRIAVPTRK